ncbi:TRAP transporter large permease [Rhodovulum sp. DZ06]|uniref:TRAP transporter large permease n=1 Tax=Rhodovulum sp. DZ06 TaxID=3425126 RepID=UPI003D335C3E
MSAFDIGLLSLGGIFGLVLLGLYVPVALMVCSFIGVWAIKGKAALASKLLALAASDAIASYHFGVVPLFVLMGFFVAEAGIGRDAFRVAQALLGRMTGGLGVATVGANALFAAITGISIASAAVFSRIAAPEMIARGYTPRFAAGIVAGSSVLGMLIPPSLLLILYAILAEQSVGDLFIAGILPGLVMAALFGAVVIGMVRFAPGFAGRPDRGRVEEPLGRVLLGGLSIALLVGLVVGGLYGGIFTPVESGAVGAAGALLLGLLRRSLSREGFGRALVETGMVTASICLLIIAAAMYSRMLAFSGVPREFGEMVAASGLGPTGVLLLYILAVIAMGMILDSSSIMLILVPLMLPVVEPMGLDLVWFGILTVIAVEIGLLTPPFGISVYVIRSSLRRRDLPLGAIFAGAAPFALAMFACLMLVLAFPPLATALMAH